MDLKQIIKEELNKFKWPQISDYKNKIFYHGRTVNSTVFSYEYVGGESAIDQYGSGFYFTNKLDKAYYYSGDDGIILKCQIDYKKIVPKSKPKRTIISTLLTKSPNANEAFLDFGQTVRQGYLEAMNVYSDLDDAYYCYETIANDFYRNNRPEFVKLLSKFYDIFIPENQEEDNLTIVCFNPEIIKVLGAVKKSEII